MDQKIQSFKTVETTYGLSKKLSILDIELNGPNSEEALREVIDLLASKLPEPPRLLSQEQKECWSKRDQKPYRFAFIKALGVTNKLSLTKAMRRIESAERFDDLKVWDFDDFWEVVSQKIKFQESFAKEG